MSQTADFFASKSLTLKSTLQNFVYNEQLFGFVNARSKKLADYNFLSIVYFSRLSETLVAK